MKVTTVKVKTLALALALLSIVACGKNKNNLNIDGTYELVSREIDGEPRKSKTRTLVEINKNLATFYTFSDDKKAVEVVQEKYIIKGRQVVGYGLMDNGCEPALEKSEVSGSVNINQGDLTFSLNVKNEASEAVVTMNLKSLPQEEFDKLTKDIKSNKVALACLDIDGKVMKKLEVSAQEEVKEEATGDEVQSDSIQEQESTTKNENTNSITIPGATDQVPL